MCLITTPYYLVSNLGKPQTMSTKATKNFSLNTQTTTNSETFFLKLIVQGSNAGLPHLALTVQTRGTEDEFNGMCTQ